MTDGIIQEVFERFRIKLDSDPKTQAYYGKNGLGRWMRTDKLEELQQELIEKIKQEHGRLTQIICSCDQHSGKLTAYNVFKTQLIGDNQE